MEHQIKNKTRAVKKLARNTLNDEQQIKLQEVYGLLEYLGALHVAWLNESATLFRRKYYESGSHADFILYMADAAHQEVDVKNLRQVLKESKGPGNFRNLFIYAPNRKKDGL